MRLIRFVVLAGVLALIMLGWNVAVHSFNFPTILRITNYWQFGTAFILGSVLTTLGRR